MNKPGDEHIDDGLCARYFGASRVWLYIAVLSGVAFVGLFYFAFHTGLLR